MEKQSDSVSTKALSEEIAALNRRIAREIGARKAAEELLEQKSLALYESNNQLKKLNESLEKGLIRRTNTLTSLIKNLHAGVLLEDENRRVILTNEMFCEIFEINWSPEDLVGTDCSESANLSKGLFKEPQNFLESVDRSIKAGTLMTNEKFEMADGRVLERDFLPIISHGDDLGHLWLYRDITQRHYLEEQIRKSEEKYRGIMENMELGLIEVDLDHHIVKAYDRFCDMIGYSQEELVGKNAITLFLPEKYQALMLEQDERRSEGAPGVYEVEMIKKNGETIWVLISGAPFFDERGKVIGSIGIHYDITNRKNLENELREARKIADHAREAEKEFLANMSHEIRNPINAITGIISLLYDTSLNKEQLEYLENIKYSADVLLGLISDILDLAKIEAGKMELNERVIDINETIEAVVNTFRFKTKEKPLEIVFNPNLDLNKKVLADPMVLNQVLLNLIGNAVKFTESGNVWVETEVLSENDQKIKVLFSIRDTGIGITEGQKVRIFESFNQADKQTKLKYGGTGLGLSIVRRLVGCYAGTVGVESELGKGSVFSFDLTLKKSNETAVKKDKKKVPAGSLGLDRVLVVEDNLMNQRYLTGFLKKWGIAFDIANNGLEALQWIDQNEYNFVLMDIRMPEMDGYEATIRIRASHDNPNCNVPIVALTASALVDERTRALDAGMNYHLTKPFSPDQLLEIFEEFGEKLSKDNQKQVFEYSEELNSAYLNEFYADDLERAAIMFGIFLKNIPQELQELETCWKEKNWERVSFMSHRIKPNFQMIGLPEFTEKAAVIENLSKEGDIVSLEQELLVFFEKYKEKHQLVERELERINQALS